MREILFKAKRISDGQWVYGNLFVDDKLEKVEILCGYTNYRIAWEVEPETICQYIGMKDKNGRMIFENDIILVCTNGFDREVFETKVLFGARSGVQGFYLENGRMMFYFGQSDLTKMDDAEVIGNSFDNQTR